MHVLNSKLKDPPKRRNLSLIICDKCRGCFILTWYFSGSPHSRIGNSGNSYFFLVSANINSRVMWRIQFEPVRKIRQSSLKRLGIVKISYLSTYIMKSKIYHHPLMCTVGSSVFKITWGVARNKGLWKTVFTYINIKFNFFLYINIKFNWFLLSHETVLLFYL